MAVVSGPTKISRRVALPGEMRQALTYLLLLVLGYLLLTPVFAWGQRRVDDMRYGFPRTTQVGGLVGHDEAGGEPTHLIALNLRGQVSILELPGGDPAKTRAIVGPYLVGADGPYVVPHLSLEDVSGDGQPDLLLQVREEIVVYINENGTFRLMTPAERAQLVSSAAQAP